MLDFLSIMCVFWLLKIGDNLKWYGTLCTCHDAMVFPGYKTFLASRNIILKYTVWNISNNLMIIYLVNLVNYHQCELKKTINKLTLTNSKEILKINVYDWHV